MLVDNEPQALDVYADVISRWGYEVCKARSYSDALDAIGQAEFDVVLVELRMPESGGFRLIEEIRSSGREFPVIAMARIPSIGTVTRAFRAGATDYVAKPFAALEIRSKIEEVLRARAARRDQQFLLRVISEKAERLAQVSSALVNKASSVLEEHGLEGEMRSIMDLSGQLADLGARLAGRMHRPVKITRVDRP